MCYVKSLPASLSWRYLRKRGVSKKDTNKSSNMEKNIIGIILAAVAAIICAAIDELTSGADE